MELQEVEAIDLHPPQWHGDRVFDDAARHRPGIGYPLRESLDLAETLRAAFLGKASPETADQVLGRAIMVCQIPCREACIVVAEHRLDRALRVYTAMRPRHLPHPIQLTTDLQICREPKPARCRQWHLDDALLAQSREIGGAVAEAFIDLGIVLAELWCDRAHLDPVPAPDGCSDMRHISEFRVIRILDHFAMLHLRVSEHLSIIVQIGR